MKSVSNIVVNIINSNIKERKFETFPYFCIWYVTNKQTD